MTERRQEPRAHVLRRGKIVYRRGHGAIDCVVLDLSTGGAKLRVGEWLGMPNRFELRVENGLAREAVVRYRALDITGVEFIDAAA